MAARRFAPLALLLVLVCALVGLGAVHAQNRVYAGAGLNLSYAPYDSLNYVLRAFGDSPSWKGDDLRPVHMPGGLTAHVGGDLRGILFDLQFTMRLAARRAREEVATSPPSDNLVQVRYNASSLDLGLGVFVVRKPRFRLALGQSLDFGSLRIKGRRGLSSSVQGQVFGQFVNELNLSTSTFAHCMFLLRDGNSPGIFVRPYFQLGFRENDLGPLNRFLRPTEALSDTYYILERQSNVGLKVGLMFGS